MSRSPALDAQEMQKHFAFEKQIQTWFSKLGIFCNFKFKIILSGDKKFVKLERMSDLHNFVTYIFLERVYP